MGAFTRSALSATIAFAAGLACASSVLAGGHHHGHRPAVYPHAPQVHPRPVSRPVPPLAVVRPLAQPVVPVPAPPVAQPVPFGFFPGTVVVLRETSVINVVPRPVRPLSFNVLDPLAVVGRSPSGRVVVVGSGPLQEPARAAHYAPPTFQIVGTPPRQHMGGRVALNHGVAPPSGVDTKPRVVWLKEPQTTNRVIKRAE